MPEVYIYVISKNRTSALKRELEFIPMRAIGFKSEVQHDLHPIELTATRTRGHVEVESSSCKVRAQQPIGEPIQPNCSTSAG